MASCRALLLDAKGHLQADLRVRRDGPDAFTVVAAPEAAEQVMGLLERYHFSEELDLIGPEEVELLTVAGAPEGAEELADLALPGTLPGTLDLVVDDAAAAIARLGLPEASAEALDMARVAAGSAPGRPGHGPHHARAGGGPRGRRRLLREGLLPGPGDRGAAPVPGPGQPRPARAAAAVAPRPRPAARCGRAGGRWAA